mmetsp:Transcript_70366/g.115720  ORF Transcript_70366/g.115720 Transcript_70366/m.115720 type:complete len:184 (+) Transcript_70366:529-1080(+)
MRPRKRKNQVTSGKEMTTKKDHAADGITADHPPGLGAVAVHRLPGMSQETSLRRERVMSRERSQVMERRGDDLVVGAVQGAGLNEAQKARRGKSEANVTRKRKAGKVEKSVHLKIVAVVVVRTTSGDILDVLVERTGKERKKTKKQNPRRKRLPKPTVPRNNMLTIKQAISEEIRQTMTLNLI